MRKSVYKLKGVSDFKGVSAFRIENEAVRNLKKQLSQIQRISNQFSDSIKPIVEATSKFQSELQPVFRLLKDSKDFEDFCDVHGWVPHSALKSHVEYPSDNSQISEVMSSWSYISNALSQDYPADILEPERNVIFNELLKAFAVGSYSIVRRSSIIEIEGLAADFCCKHDSDSSNKRKNIVEKAPDHIGKLTPRELGGMLPYKAMKKYSDKIFMGTKSPKFLDSDNQARNVNRHSQAHGSKNIADNIDAINSIFLLHHYAKYFALLENIVARHKNSIEVFDGLKKA